MVRRRPRVEPIDDWQEMLPLCWVTQRILPLSERRDDFAEIQKNATGGYLPPTV